MNALSFRLLLTLGVVGVMAIDLNADVTAQHSYQFRPIEAKPGDEFGHAAAIDGHLAILGAPGVDDNGSNSGAAYVFDLRTGTQISKLLPLDGMPDDSFGTSVSIDGNLAVVGSYLANARGRSSGAAYLFDVSTGRQLHKIVGQTTDQEDEFGISVDIDGNVVIVGAHMAGAGKAYLFDASSGSQIGILEANDAAPDDLFGVAVALDGNIALVGARYDDDLGIAAGSAYLFDVASGTQLHKLYAHDGYWGDRFGMYLDIDGNTAIVASRYDDDAVKSSGSAYLFDVDTGKERFKIVADDQDPNDHFGSSVSVSGGLAVIGAVNDEAVGIYAGSAYLFDVHTGKQITKLNAEDGGYFDQFGHAVAIDGNTVVVGATQLNFNGTTDPLPSGKAYVYQIQVPEPNMFEPNMLFMAAWAFGSLLGRRRRSA